MRRVDGETNPSSNSRFDRPKANMVDLLQMRFADKHRERDTSFVRFCRTLLRRGNMDPEKIDPKADESAVPPEAPKPEAPTRTEVVCKECGEIIGKAKTVDEARAIAADHRPDCKSNTKFEVPKLGKSAYVLLGLSLVAIGAVITVAALTGKGKIEK